MNSSQKALFLEQQIIQEITHAPNGAESDWLLRLLGFCLHHLGVGRQSISSLPGATIQELLDHNDIHHRPVKAPLPPISNEYPLLIVFDEATNSPLALYRASRQNWIYDARSNRHYLAPPDIDLLPEAYEVYPSLPTDILGPLSVLKFSFSTETAAIVALLATSGAVMVFNLFIPVLTNLLVSRILPQNDLILLFQGFLAVFLITLALVSSQFLQNLMMLRLESIADLRLQTAVWDRVLRLPLNFLSRFSSGDLVSRVDSISQLRQLLGSGVLSSILSSLFALSFFGLMFIYDAPLALWSLIFIVAVTCCLSFFLYKAVVIQLPLLELGAEITNFSFQAVNGVCQVRSAASEPFILLRWIKDVSRYAELQRRSNFYDDAARQYILLSTPLLSLFVFLMIIVRVIHGSGSQDSTSLVVSFISFYAALTSFNASFTGLIGLLANTAGRAYVLWRRAEPILYASVEPGYRPTTIRHHLVGGYELCNIKYGFGDNTGTLFDSLAFKIPANLHTAITGPSGSGKTTLVRMLLGFVQPQEGQIYVDGIPISQLSIRFYRRQVGVVLQMVKLIPGTVYDIVCGGVESSESAVWDALEKAALLDEVRAMPMKLHTFINGSNISGGQAQRLAIARALLTNPKVLIMDEATSALDNRSQQVIADTVASLGITRITIAHRLSTIQKADQIIVIQDGRMTECGDWASLSRHGYISQMLQLA